MDASTPFKWLDLLEQEFDRNYAFIDVLLDEAEFEDSYLADGGTLVQIRQRFSYLSGAFGQLLHKALTIMQTNLKLEARLLAAEEDTARTEARCKTLADEVRVLRAQLAAAASQTTQKSILVEQVDPDPEIIKLIEEDGQRRMLTAFRSWLAVSQHNMLKQENQELKQDLLATRSETEAMKLTLRYLDKERAGRIQQIQLLSNPKMPVEERNRVWTQLETEIALQRCKTVVQTCLVRQPKASQKVPSSQKVLNNSAEIPSVPVEEPVVGEVRIIKYSRPSENGALGLSIVGGRDVTLPIIVSSVTNDSPLAGQIFVGDLIKAANGIDLSYASRQEAVESITAPPESLGDDLELTVVYLGGADDSLRDDDLVTSGSLNSSQQLDKDDSGSAKDAPGQHFEPIWLQSGMLWPALPSGLPLSPDDPTSATFPQIMDINRPPPPSLFQSSAEPNSKLISESALEASLASSSATSTLLYPMRALSPGARTTSGAVITLKTGVQPRDGDTHDESNGTVDYSISDSQLQLDSALTNDNAFSADV